MNHRLLVGDALPVLRTLEPESVQCVVTSPPYWGLRDYGTSGQLGLERTPEEYVGKLVEVFREVRRVLRKDGTVWLVLGDSYAGYWGDKTAKREGRRSSADTNGWTNDFNMNARPDFHTAFDASRIKPKDLVGIPWRVAFALQADGWWLRSDIIWAKPNPMPESVTDRPTKSHEYIFLLTKSARYYFDQEAVREDGASYGRQNSLRTDKIERSSTAISREWHAPPDDRYDIPGRNIRSVWNIATQPFPEAHFATFPEALAARCIKAGSRPAGKRCDCADLIETPTGAGQIDDPSMEVGRAGFDRPRRFGEGTRPITRREQRGYADQMRASEHREDMAEVAGTAFAHYVRKDASGARPLPASLLGEWRVRGWLHDPEPCRCPVGEADTVLDPFCGSGTAGAVAVALQRNFIGIELNPAYVEMAERRIDAVAPLFARVGA